MATYHERLDALSSDAHEIHRALASIIEELEAVDWYHQRIDVSEDRELIEILTHNRNEELEHAAMVLEWLRRKMPEADDSLRTYLFQTGSIVHLEEHTEHTDTRIDQPPVSLDGDLGIGRFKRASVAIGVAGMSQIQTISEEQKHE